MAIETYFCRECGREERVGAGAEAPECCGEVMTPREGLSPPHPMTAETDRFEDEDEPFDEAGQ